MNTAQYTSQLSYPLSTEGLDFIQNQILTLEQIAAAFGDGNWILSGMKNSGGTLTAGVVAVVTDGVAEIVNYPGGDSNSALNGKWKIVTTVNSSPSRTIKTLVADNSGSIYSLKRANFITVKSLSNYPSYSLYSMLTSHTILNICGKFETPGSNSVPYTVLAYEGNGVLILLKQSDMTVSRLQLTNDAYNIQGVFFGTIIYTS